MQKIRDLEKLFIPTDLPVDEQRKRRFLLLFLALLTPALFIVSIFNVMMSRVTTADRVLWFGVGFGVLSLLSLRYLYNIKPMFYTGFTVTLAIISYQSAVGTAGGMAFLWFYFFPLSTFFLFGKYKGLIWVLPSWVIALGLLVFDLGPYHYPDALAVRFMVTYTLVAIFSYNIEASRSQYYEQLLAEKASLEAALHEVKTLHGLLPICASCKKIRDDGGYWHQVESYISRHTEVQFSHSICPECRAQLYPEYHARLVAQQR